MAMLIGVVVLCALFAVCAYGFVTESKRADRFGSHPRAPMPAAASSPPATSKEPADS